MTRALLVGVPVVVAVVVAGFALTGVLSGRSTPPAGSHQVALSGASVPPTVVYVCQAGRKLRSQKQSTAAGLLSCSAHGARRPVTAPAGATVTTLRPGSVRRVTCPSGTITGRRIARSMVQISCTATSPATSPTASPSATATPPPTGSGSPAGAPAGATAVCDTAGLKGAASAPSGAVTVKPGQDLGTVVNNHGKGQTYWLAPGTHKLGTGAYDQVQPHSGDTYIGAPGAVLDGQHKNQYAFVGSATGVTIKNLTIQNFGAAGGNNNEGVVNHDSASDWTISASTIQKNAGAGVMLGSGDKLLGSCIRDNGQYAFNAYNAKGIRDITLTGNEISGNNTDDWEKRSPNCGCSGGGKFWDVDGAKVTDNYVHDNRGVGLWADTNNSGFLFQHNYIASNDGEGLFYEISYNAAILDNTFVRNAIKAGPSNPGFPTGAIYLSESGSDSRVPGAYGQQFRIAGNSFIDNWSGIVEWENADRFAGSPANTSSGTTTMVNPAATEKACSTPGTIAKKPFIDDCRWKTQNVVVEGNSFSLDPSKIAGCTAAKGCGFNGMFSQYGSYPSWSPYRGYKVPDDITYHQNNVWNDNTYTGPWRFMARTAGNEVSWESWRSTIKQDMKSSLKQS